MRRSGWSIWRQVLAFHLQHPLQVLPLVPFLLLPIFGDILYTVLIREQRMPRPANMFRCLLKAVYGFPELFYLKFVFMISGAFWSLLPIIGWYRNFRLTICWAMAANVVIYENGAGGNSYARCGQLADLNPSLAMSTMLRIPGFFIVLLLITLGVGVQHHDEPILFYFVGVCGYLLLIPGLSAANTMLYLSLTESAVKNASA